jgi:hypothetical protein
VCSSDLTIPRELFVKAGLMAAGALVASAPKGPAASCCGGATAKTRSAAVASAVLSAGASAVPSAVPSAGASCCCGGAPAGGAPAKTRSCC